ncbi:hypothetical protein JCM1840_007212 [Sporobolomyces johnsonii]
MPKLSSIPSSAQPRLAEFIAQMHLACPSAPWSDQSGFGIPTCCGVTQQDNTPSDSWEEFYSERRIGDMVQRIGDAQISKLGKELQSSPASFGTLLTDTKNKSALTAWAEYANATYAMDSEQDSSSTGAEEPKLNLNTIKVGGNGSCHSKLLAITSRDCSYVRVLVGSANQSLNGQGRQHTPGSRTTGNISVEQGGLFDFPVDSIDLHQFAATYEKLKDEATLQGDLVPHDLDTTFAVLPGFTLSDDIPEALKKRQRYGPRGPRQIDLARATAIGKMGAAASAISRRAKAIQRVHLIYMGSSLAIGTSLYLRGAERTRLITFSSKVIKSGATPVLVTNFPSATTTITAYRKAASALPNPSKPCLQVQILPPDGDKIPSPGRWSIKIHWEGFSWTIEPEDDADKSETFTPGGVRCAQVSGHTVFEICLREGWGGLTATGGGAEEEGEGGREGEREGDHEGEEEGEYEGKGKGKSKMFFWPDSGVLNGASFTSPSTSSASFTSPSTSYTSASTVAPRQDFVEGRFRPEENLAICRLVEAGVELKEIARQLNRKKTSIYNHMPYLYLPEELRNMAASRAPPKKKRKTAKSGTSLDASRESAEAGPSNLAEESDKGVGSSGGLETL